MTVTTHFKFNRTLQTSRALFLGLLAWLGACSRANVESLEAMNVGVAAAQQQQFEQAVEHFQKSAALDPTNDQAYQNLGIVYLKLDKLDDARMAFEKAMAAAPHNATYPLRLAGVLSSKGDFAGARGALEQAIRIDETRFRPHYDLARVHEQLDDPQNALRQYTAAARKGPRFLSGYTSLARLYEDLGYVDEAAQVLEAALVVALPGTEERSTVHHMLGTVYEQSGKLDAAVTQFEQAITVSPDRWEPLFSLAWVQASLGDPEPAAASFEKFLALGGAGAPPHYVRAARQWVSEHNSRGGK